MKILVLHGDNNIKSFNRYREIIDSSKKKGWEVRSLASEGNNLNIAENLASSSLFSNKVLFTLDDFDKLRKRDFDWLKKSNAKLPGFFLIYRNDVINKTKLKMLPKSFKEQEFPLPKLIWKFLDSVYPKNSKVSLKLLKEVIVNEPVEFVFHLLARHLRDLYWVSTDPKSLPYQSWRVGKLKRQAGKFKENQLQKLIKALVEIDIKVKKSKENLSDLLDFTLASNLE